MSSSSSDCCFICNLKLSFLYFHCCVCQRNICPFCFSCGKESPSPSVVPHHINTHSYKVINLKEMSTIDNWSVADELTLIEHLMSNCNTSSMLDHWMSNNNNPSSPNLKQKQMSEHIQKWLELFRSSNENLFIEDATQTTAYSYNKACVSRNPPRPQLHSINYRNMSGYRPARGEFDTEWNDSFELSHIADLDYVTASTAAALKHYSNDNNKKIIVVDNDEEEEEEEEEDEEEEMLKLETDLKLTLLDIYNDVLRERYKRKLFIRKFGLLNEILDYKHKDSLLFQQLRKRGNTNNTREQQIKDTNCHYNILPVKFQRLFASSDQYREHVELVRHQTYLQQRLAELNEYRDKGLRHLRHQVPIYRQLRQRRLQPNTDTFHMSSLLQTVSLAPNSTQLDNMNKENLQHWFKKFILNEKKQQQSTQCQIMLETKVKEEKEAIMQDQTPNTEHEKPKLMITDNNNNKTGILNSMRIENYPEYDRLNCDEKEFCRVGRIQPTVYLRVRDLIQLEFRKNGECSYSRARKIAAINVNKTRLIHNFMINQRLINININKQK